MTDWSKPVITSDYVAFVDEVKTRDVDAITLQLTPLINCPTGAIKLLRAPVKFQEWDGSAFQDRVLSLEGGGTGASAATGARTNLGLGTMAVQNSNAIAVTGGTIANVNSSGSFGHQGGQINFMPAAPGNHTLAVYGRPTAGLYPIIVTASDTPSASYGVLIQSGYTRSDQAFHVVNRLSSLIGILIDGQMTASFPTRLVIPVGVDFWAPA